MTNDSVEYEVIEQYAKSQGHKAQMFFIAPPSSDEGDEYLLTLWGSVKQCIDDQQMSVYGFRFMDKFENGVPRLCVLLFSEDQDRTALYELIKQSVLEGNAPEVNVRCFEAVRMDFDKGSPVEYMLRYMPENTSVEVIHEGLQ